MPIQQRICKTIDNLKFNTLMLAYSDNPVTLQGIGKEEASSLLEEDLNYDIENP